MYLTFGSISRSQAIYYAISVTLTDPRSLDRSHKCACTTPTDRYKSLNIIAQVSDKYIGYIYIVL